MHDDTAPRRCLVAVSSHGFRHFAQVAPILSASKQLFAERHLNPPQWVIRSALPAELIQTRLTAPLTIDPGADDFGMVMYDARHTDLASSLRRYSAFFMPTGMHASNSSHNTCTR